MLISRRRKFIFIHNYKTAGTSITNALKPYTAPLWHRALTKVLKKLRINPGKFDHQPYRSHITASELIDNLGEKEFNSYFSFAFVRNPWDWQVSLYKYMLKNNRHKKHEIIKNFTDFEEYIKWHCNQDVVLQSDFILSHNCEKLVSFVGKFESLNSDFETICSKIGIKVSLPKMNVSNNIPYREFYNEETKELVAKKFKVDINRFGYKF